MIFELILRVLLMTGRVQDEHPVAYMFSALLVFGAIFLGIYLYVAPPEYDGSETIAIGATELINEFSRDEAFSALQYEGKWLEITGLAGSTEMVGRGVKLRIRPVDYDDGLFPNLRTVICYLSDLGEEQYLKDRPRGKITVIGTFLRNGTSDVFVEGCQFVY